MITASKHPALPVIFIALLAIHPPLAAHDLPEGVVAEFGSSRFRAGGQLDTLQFSAGGKQLATRNVSHLVFRWEIDSGKLLEAKQLTKADPYRPLPFLQPGVTRRGSAATVSGAVATIRLADSKEVVELNANPGARFEAIALSDDETTAATADNYGKRSR